MKQSLSKFNNLIQAFRYSRPYRAPLQLIQNLRFANSDFKQSIRLKMRLGHQIELVATQPYLKRVVMSRSYHDEGVFYLEPFLGKGAVMIDVGANIGLLSCAYAHNFQHLNPTIYAIEAVEQNYFRLLKNIELNHFKSIKPFRLAFGREKGSISFKLPSREFSGNAVGTNVLSESDIKQIDGQSTYEEVVDLVTMDDWAREQKIDRCDFIKIDVEGAEIFVFQGARNFITKTRPIIQCEFNGYWLEQQGLGLKDYLDFFKDMDYQCYVDEGDSFQKLDPNNFRKSLVDLLFVPSEKNQS